MRKPQIVAIAGLGYGDEGKGKITDYLVRKIGASAVVRYNGGPQAAHTVVMQDGRSHKFSQFGSGSFVSGCRTHLSGQTLISVASLLGERDKLVQDGVYDAMERLSISTDSVIVTPYHQMVNQMKEMSRKERLGSCGMGVGEAISESQTRPQALRMKDVLLSDNQFKAKFDEHHERRIEEASKIARDHPSLNLSTVFNDFAGFPYSKVLDTFFIFRENYRHCFQDDLILKQMRKANMPIVMEGAQGVLLDSKIGFVPYVTKSRTTFDAARSLLGATGYHGSFHKIGILRAYHTRHGAGPFVTYDEKMTETLPDLHNPENPWQGRVKAGWFDLIAARYAIEQGGGVDELAITCLDRLIGAKEVKMCYSYLCETTPNPELEELFDYTFDSDGCEIFAIRPTGKVSQERLTYYLNRCKPHGFMDAFKSWSACDDYYARTYLDAIENALDIPIYIVSYGPTAEETYSTAP